MADLIKTVSDKDQFQFLLDNFFKDASIFIKTSSMNIALQYIGYSDGNVAFRIPMIKSSPDSVVVYTRHKSSTIYLSMKFLERNEDTFVYIPIKFQIISESRKEDRKPLGMEGGKNIMYINNLITEYIIGRGLATAEKKLDKVKEFAQFELKNKFERMRLFFVNDGRDDLRFKHIVETSEPIFIPSISTPPGPPNEEAFNYYINRIYKSDISLSKREKFISEITVPLRYNDAIIYGYIQVNGHKPLNHAMLDFLRRMSIAINQLMVKNQLFFPIEAKFLVGDISRNGLGFVFKDKKFLRLFDKGSKINFEIILPTQKKAVIGAVVKNVTFLENRIVKTGCEIDYMDDISRANYDEFIKLVSKN